MNTPKSSINFRRIMDLGQILLVHLPDDEEGLGEDGAYLLGAFILAELHWAALSRRDTPKDQRRKFTALCDEWIYYGTGVVPRIVRKDRKYKFSVGLFTQTLTGTEKLQTLIAEVLAVVGSVWSFGLSTDAKYVATLLFTGDEWEVKYTRTRWQKRPRLELNLFGFDFQWGEWYERFDEPVFYTLEEQRARAERQLRTVPPQHLWFKWGDDLNARLVKVPTIKEVETLPDAARLPELLAIQDAAARRLCSDGKVKTSAVPDVIYLPASANWTQPPQETPAPYIPLWAPWPTE